ncbi:HlyD family efflux transporter periplasmic adaptor subunit, partial [Shewanella xiamenensis]|nr:HlyD family secretion protein [Shewanella xiamenensis]MDI5843617.1 HlyD family secretion protein [Shewanella xiamenensis]MDI5851820.1 HlyD family secretion protein [Shewanella xiamenensis]MDI5855844.1 HlyD family secretion protein [Shewanella xiamenensis]MDI5859633.1 HlyD family secretion protein [Shewanella xiamenensis]
FLMSFSDYIVAHCEADLKWMGPFHYPYVRVYLPATWLDRVKAGNQVKILVDGRTQPIAGTVRNIRSQPAYTPFYALNERDRARLMYLTDIDISPEGQDLPTGMALEVQLP